MSQLSSRFDEIDALEPPKGERTSSATKYHYSATTTSTTTASGSAVASEPSLHLTVGLDVMLEQVRTESLDLSHFHMLGGNPRSPVARQLAPKLQEALSLVAHRDLAMRRSVESSVFLAGAYHAGEDVEDDDAERVTGAWKTIMRTLMHDVVDTLLDNTTCERRTGGRTAPHEHDATAHYVH